MESDPRVANSVQGLMRHMALASSNGATDMVWPERQYLNANLRDYSALPSHCSMAQICQEPAAEEMGFYPQEGFPQAARPA